jgi:TolB-like protein
MLRSLSYVTRIAVAATLALPAIAFAQADTRPIIAVLNFDNNAIGPAAAEYAGMGKGVQDLVITDMAANPKFRIVDRDRIQTLLQEQNLIKSGAIDGQTAVRLGKILGAQYVIFGGFMTDGKSTAVLTGRTVDVETSAIANPQKVTGKTDNVLELIGQLSTKLNNDIKLDAKPVRVGDAGSPSGAKQSGTPASSKGSATTSKPATVETFAKRVSDKSMQVKLDLQTVKVYSSAIEEMDRKNNTKAIELFKQVLNKYPEFEPASDKLSKLSPKAGD